MWKVNAATVAVFINGMMLFTPKECKDAGKNTAPSNAIAKGVKIMKAPIVINENRPIEPPTCIQALILVCCDAMAGVLSVFCYEKINGLLVWAVLLTSADVQRVQ